MDPTNITVKAHPKSSSGDYMALPALNEYETPFCQMSNTTYYYEIDVPSADGDNIEYSTVNEALPDNEQIYEDPGYKQEKIYAWFEKMKFRMLKRNDVRYVCRKKYLGLITSAV